MEMWVVEAISQSPPLLEASMDQFNSVVTVTYVLLLLLFSFTSLQFVSKLASLYHHSLYSLSWFLSIHFTLLRRLSSSLPLPHFTPYILSYFLSLPLSHSRCVHRSFGPEQWKGLQQRLNALRASVAVVLDSAKKYNN